MKVKITRVEPTTQVSASGKKKFYIYTAEGDRHIAWGDWVLDAKDKESEVDIKKSNYKGVDYVPIGARPTPLYGNKASPANCYGGKVVVLDPSTGNATAYDVAASPIPAGRPCFFSSPGWSSSAVGCSRTAPSSRASSVCPRSQASPTCIAASKRGNG